MLSSPFEGLCVIDADTHFTEPYDLWTSRAPAAYRDRVPQVRPIDGSPTWVMEDAVLSKVLASGVIRRDGVKVLGMEFLTWGIDDLHAGAHSSRGSP